MKDTEIDQLLNWKPLGQKILESKYSIINIDEIEKRLGKEKLLKDSCDKQIKKIEKEGFKIIGKYIYSDRYTIIIEQNQFYWDHEYGSYFHKSIRLETRNLDYWLIKLPDNILTEIRKAKNIGLNEFYINYLVIDKPQSDPIITAKFGNQYLFIIQF